MNVVHADRPVEFGHPGVILARPTPPWRGEQEAFAR
jgi:hypothetical protein